MYRLTDEARTYIKNGLPEKKLIELLKEGSMTISEAKNRVDNFSIALGWAKKNGWVKIENETINLIKIPNRFEQEEALKRIENGEDVEERLIKILLSRKLIEEVKEDVVTRAKKQLKQGIATITPELIKTGLWRKIKLKSYNVEIIGKRIYHGKRHPYNRFLREVRRKLIELGFKEMKAPIIETEFWNFDALYQPQDHPSRDWAQTYSLKYPKYGDLPNKKIVERVKSAHENGWKTGSTGWKYKWDPRKAAMLMPRAHTTSCSARQLARGVEIPGKYFIIGRCFRPDVIDVSHGVEFNHCDGIAIDSSITFKNLLDLLKTFAIEIAGIQKVKFFPDYYPFVEPGVQLSAKHPEIGWIELAGAGIFRPEVTQPLGIKEPVIAWGLGIDRLAMFRLKIKDIRELFSQKLDWLQRSVIND